MLSWALITVLSADPPVEPPGSVTRRVRHDDESLIRLVVQSRAELHAALAVSVDMWTEHPTPGAVDVVVDPSGLAALGMAGVNYRVLLPDIQVPVDAELARLVGAGGALPVPGEFFDDFRPYAQVLDHLQALVALRPDLATIVDVGSSIEGRAIQGIRIGTAVDAPGMVLNGCQHAREWITVMTAACIADTLVNDYDTDPELASLVDQVTFTIVPIVNPDGYIHSWNSDRYWRKNRRGSFGVDLNRNWGVAWGGEGSSSELDSGNYRGDFAFSEPEAAGLRDLILATANATSHVDIHSYGQFILYPWGFDHVLAPANDALRDLALMMADRMEGPHGMLYDPIQAADFYPAAGNMPDWTYGDRGMFGFTIELRPAESPDENFVAGFVLPPEEIVPTCDETLEAIKGLAEFSILAGPGSPGDDGSVTDTGALLDLGAGATSDTGDSMTGDGGTASSDPNTSGTTEPTSDTGDDGGSGGANGRPLSERGCGCALPGSDPSLFLGPLVVLGLRRRRRT